MDQSSSTLLASRRSARRSTTVVLPDPDGALDRDVVEGHQAGASGRGVAPHRRAVGAAGEELGHGEAEHGVDGRPGAISASGREDEPPLGEARMGKHEPRPVAPLVAEEEDVHVDRARAVPLRAHAPHLALGGEARLEERLGRERGLPARHRVQEPALRRPPHRLGEPERAADASPGSPRAASRASAPSIAASRSPRFEPRPRKTGGLHVSLIIHGSPSGATV